MKIVMIINIFHFGIATVMFMFSFCKIVRVEDD